MSKHLIHIEGESRGFSLQDKLSDNYDLPNNFGGDNDGDVFDETIEVIPNMVVKLYTSDKEKPLEEIEENHIRQLLGDASISGNLDGYSEYTITGFTVNKFFIGNHNLQDIIDHQYDKYIHLTLEWED